MALNSTPSKISPAILLFSSPIYSEIWNAMNDAKTVEQMVNADALGILRVPITFKEKISMQRVHIKSYTVLYHANFNRSSNGAVNNRIIKPAKVRASYKNTDRSFLETNKIETLKL